MMCFALLTLAHVSRSVVGPGGLIRPPSSAVCLLFACCLPVVLPFILLTLLVFETALVRFCINPLALGILVRFNNCIDIDLRHNRHSSFST